MSPRGALGSFELMRTLNRLAVLNAVRHDGTISRAQLTERTGLTSGAITYIVEELLAARLVNEVGQGRSSGGRRPIMLELNSRALYAVGINLGVGHTVAVLLDLRATVVHRLVVETPAGAPVLGVVETIVSLVRRLVAESGVATDLISGIGIGVPGQHDLDHGVVRLSPNLGWRDVPFRDLLAAHFAWPVIVDNDVRAATLAEKWYGVGRDADVFACVFVGSGIGSGIVFNGQLLRGATGTAGELGHTTVVEYGPRCACGNYGCLESVASRRAIVRRAAKDLGRGHRGPLRDLVGGDADRLTLDLIIEAARTGDTAACETLRLAGRYLGIGLANLVNLVNPRVLAIGGSVMRAGDLVLGPAREALAARTLEQPREAVVLATPRLQDPGALGAATLVSRQLFLPPPYEGGPAGMVGQELGLATLRDLMQPEGAGLPDVLVGTP